MAWLSSSLFRALAVPVDLDNRCVNHGVFHVGIVGDGVEYPFENIGFNPMPEPLEHCVPRPELRRQVAPRAAGPRDPQNGFEEQPPISSRSPRIGLFAEAMRFDHLPLGIGQNKTIHESSFGELELNSRFAEIPESQQALGRS